MAEPLVSIVVPTYNRAGYLREALQSISAQQYRPIEIIVVDDGSDDETATVVEGISPIRYLRQPNQGVAAARNAGIAASRGQFIAFLDSDDLWEAQKLEVQVKFHAHNPQLSVSITHFCNFLEPGCRRPAWLRQELMTGNHVGYLPSALLASRSVFERIGDFNPRLRAGEDSDWFFRVRDAGIPIGVIRNVLLRRRIHGHNLSGQNREVQAILLQTLRASLRRCRGEVPVQDRLNA